VWNERECWDTSLWIPKACYGTANLTGYNLLIEKSDRFMSRKRKITSEEQIFVPKRKMLQKWLFVGMTGIRKAAKEKTSEQKGMWCLWNKMRWRIQDADKMVNQSWSKKGLKRRIYKTGIMWLLTLFSQIPQISLLPTQWDSKLL